MECIPAQWADVDKNEKLRAETFNPKPKMKPRLVARRDLHNQYGRIDLPTMDNEGIHMFHVLLVCRFD